MMPIQVYRESHRPTGRHPEAVQIWSEWQTAFGRLQPFPRRSIAVMQDTRILVDARETIHTRRGMPFENWSSPTNFRWSAEGISKINQHLASAEATIQRGDGAKCLRGLWSSPPQFASTTVVDARDGSKRLPLAH